MWSAILVFVLSAVVDAFWAWYIASVAAGNIWKAVLSCAIIYEFNSLITLEYVHDSWLRHVAAIGGMLGTAILMKYQEKKSEAKTIARK